MMKTINVIKKSLRIMISSVLSCVTLSAGLMHAQIDIPKKAKTVFASSDFAKDMQFFLGEQCDGLNVKSLKSIVTDLQTIAGQEWIDFLEKIVDSHNSTYGVEAFNQGVSDAFDQFQVAISGFSDDCHGIPYIEQVLGQLLQCAFEERLVFQHMALAVDVLSNSLDHEVACVIEDGNAVDCPGGKYLIKLSFQAAQPEVFSMGTLNENGTAVARLYGQANSPMPDRPLGIFSSLHNFVETFDVLTDATERSHVWPGLSWFCLKLDGCSTNPYIIDGTESRADIIIQNHRAYLASLYGSAIGGVVGALVFVAAAGCSIYYCVNSSCCSG